MQVVKFFSGTNGKNRLLLVMYALAFVFTTIGVTLIQEPMWFYLLFQVLSTVGFGDIDIINRVDDSWVGRSFIAVGMLCLFIANMIGNFEGPLYKVPLK